MRNAKRIVRAVLIALLPALLCVSALAQNAGTPDKTRQNLSTSPDGKFMVDPNGKKVLQYLDSAKAFVPLAVEKKPDGKLRLSSEVSQDGGHTFYPCNCRNECIAWDTATGKCTQTYRTCDICVK